MPIILTLGTKMVLVIVYGEKLKFKQNLLYTLLKKEVYIVTIGKISITKCNNSSGFR